MSDFRVSTNIVRDSGKPYKYFVTKNAQNIFNDIVSSFKDGFHSFNLIGSYGTGKSSFLVALESQLKLNKRIFNNKLNIFSSANELNFIKIIGEYSSFQSCLKIELGLKNSSSTKQVLSELDKHVSKNKYCFLVVDEFGKFLEYAAKNNPAEELYFLQQLAEHIDQTNFALITTLHQNFSGYAGKVDQNDKSEWEKVRGRFRDLTFNEPIDQLVELSSEVLYSRFGQSFDHCHELSELIVNSNLTDLKNSELKNNSNKLAPFDYLSAYVLASSLQKYGQNERSLFSFFATNTEVDMFVHESKWYTVSNVYDYLQDQFGHTLVTRDNPDLSQWTSIRIAIEKVESLVDHNTDLAVKIIKTIGLLNLFTNSVGGLNKKFLLAYFKILFGMNISKIISELEEKRIIKFVRYRNRYILFDGTDIDIEFELLQAESYVDRNIDLSKLTSELLDLPVQLARKHFIESGTPRFFPFLITSEPVNTTKDVEYDGFINVVLSNTISKNQIAKYSKLNSSGQIYVLFSKADEVYSRLFDIEKLDYTLKNIKDDRVAARELSDLLSNEVKSFRDFMFENIYSPSKSIHWYINGERLNGQLVSKARINRILSNECDRVYSSSPKLKNELINRTKVPSAINTARRTFIRLLLENPHLPDLGIDEQKFPPEKTIYRALLRNSGIHSKASDGSFRFQEPTQNSFKPLWKYSIDFLERAKLEKISLNEFLTGLKAPPISLKNGVLSFWLPAFLIIHNEDYALFGESGYIPFLTDEVINLISKYPEKFSIKTSDVSGVRLQIFNSYRSLLEQPMSNKANSTSFIDTVRPFLLFYRGLPEYSKSTKTISKQAANLREAIKNSKDPEQTFFEDFPAALGYFDFSKKFSTSELKTYSEHLQNSINEIKTAFSSLHDRVESILTEALGVPNTSFEEYKPLIMDRFKSINKNILSKELGHFVNRLLSPLDDRDAWLNAISDSLLKKRLEAITDGEEMLLYSKLQDAFVQLELYVDSVELQKSSGTVFAAKVSLIDGVTGTATKKSGHIHASNNKNVNKVISKIEDVFAKLNVSESDRDSVLIKLLQGESNGKS